MPDDISDLRRYESLLGEVCDAIDGLTALEREGIELQPNARAELISAIQEGLGQLQSAASQFAALRGPERIRQLELLVHEAGEIVEQTDRARHAATSAETLPTFRLDSQA